MKSIPLQKMICFIFLLCSIAACSTSVEAGKLIDENLDGYIVKNNTLRTVCVTWGERSEHQANLGLNGEDKYNPQTSGRFPITATLLVRDNEELIEQTYRIFVTEQDKGRPILVSEITALKDIVV